MKPSTFRRIRRRSAHEAPVPKKDTQQEQPFFGETSPETFFPPSAVIRRKCETAEGADNQLHRKEDKKEEEKMMRMEDKKEEDQQLMKKENTKDDDEKLQKKGAATPFIAGVPAGSYINSLGGKGNPLPSSAKQFFAARMGYDFRHVKIHTGKEAAQSAKDINAKAYTIGNNIVFNEGEYDTQSGDGKKLLAHELAHVIQQTNGNGQHINPEQLHRKVIYSLPSYKKEDPIPKIIGSGGKLGLTYITINGQQLTTKLGAEKAIFEAVNKNLSLTHDASAKTCKVDTSNVKIDVSAAITLPTEPVNDKWSGRYPGRLVTGSAYCSQMPFVNIEMVAKPSGGQALCKSVHVDEAQHFTDILEVSEKHIEAYHTYLDGITLKADNAADCPARFSAEIGNKDYAMATAFVNDWLTAVNKWDNPAGPHHYKSLTDARNCNLVTVTVSF